MSVKFVSYEIVRVSRVESLSYLSIQPTIRQQASTTDVPLAQSSPSIACLCG
jgi:hypothetical protein